MEDELHMKDKMERIDSLELLVRFNLDCQKKAKETELKSHLGFCSDLVSAVYYFRRYPDVEVFINSYLKNSPNYFQIQWVRATWAHLNKLTKEGLSDLVINQISFIANLEEAQ